MKRSGIIFMLALIFIIILSGCSEPIPASNTSTEPVSITFEWEQYYEEANYYKFINPVTENELMYSLLWISGTVIETESASSVIVSDDGENRWSCMFFDEEYNLPTVGNQAKFYGVYEGISVFDDPMIAVTRIVQSGALTNINLDDFEMYHLFEGYTLSEMQEKYASKKEPEPEPKSEFETYVEDNEIELAALDVKFDMRNSIDKLFTVEGKAELSTYFNYGWRDAETTHFSVRVRPTSGSFSDSWTIYFSREKYNDFFDELKTNRELYVRMICKIPRSRYSERQDELAEGEFVEWGY